MIKFCLFLSLIAIILIIPINTSGDISNEEAESLLISPHQKVDDYELWHIKSNVSKNHSVYVIINRTIILKNDKTILIYSAPDLPFKLKSYKMYYKNKIEDFPINSSGNILLRKINLEANNPLTISFATELEPNYDGCYLGNGEIFSIGAYYELNPYSVDCISEIILPYPLNPNAVTEKYIPLIEIGSYYNNINYFRQNFDIYYFNYDTFSKVIIKKKNQIPMDIDLFIVILITPSPKVEITMVDEVDLTNALITRNINIYNNQNESITYSNEENSISIESSENEYYNQNIIVIKPFEKYDDRYTIYINQKTKPYGKLNFLGYPFDKYIIESKHSINSNINVSNVNSSAYINYKMRTKLENKYTLDTSNSKVKIIPNNITIPIISEHGFIAETTIPSALISNSENNMLGYVSFQTDHLMGVEYSSNIIESKFKKYSPYNLFESETYNISSSFPSSEYDIEYTIILKRKFNDWLFLIIFLMFSFIVGYTIKQQNNVTKTTEVIVSLIIPLALGLVDKERLSIGVIILFFTSFYIGRKFDDFIKMIKIKLHGLLS